MGTFSSFCGIVNDSFYWDVFRHPDFTAEAFSHYARKFILSVPRIMNEKGIDEETIDSFAKKRAIHQYKIACKKYLQTELYDQESVEQDGYNLLLPLCVYEWICEYFGVSSEDLRDILIRVGEKCTEELLG